MRKSTLVILITALSITASGCGKQGVEPVIAKTVEEVTLVNEEESLSVATEEETESIEESDENAYATVEAEEAKEDFTITELNLEMQATQNAMTYENPDGITEVSGVRKDEIIAVIGKVDDTNWYQIDQEGFKSFIDGKYLKEIEVQQQAQADQNENNNNNQNDNKDNSQDQNKDKDKDQNQNPPVVNPPAPPADDTPAPMLPDGGFVTDDGTVVHPGDYMPDGSTVYMGNGDSWWDE